MFCNSQPTRLLEEQTVKYNPEEESPLLLYSFNGLVFKMLLHQILADYPQIQQGSPSYFEMKNSCLYLHNKLSDIQSRISEFYKQ
ncbi:RNA polymerase II elongation factor ELL2-like [Parus major]|uniref:RNA polymerase II elongation factor ELL2-like n=1 Tax=Parus major TaxID=9157 RepID=UPI0007712FC7|nr:RNA polymerase II elongation factor ELL2-like [Parus major]